MSLCHVAAVLSLSLLVACGSDPAEKSATPAAGGYQVSGGFLHDPDGRVVVLRGVNLASAHKSGPDHLGFHQPADYARVHDEFGMNSIRFLVSWAGIEPKEGVFDEAYLDELAKRMDWAEEAGLSVVLDMHQDVYGEGFGYNGAPRWACDEANYASFEPGESWFFDYLKPEVTACVDEFWAGGKAQDHYVGAWQKLAQRLVSRRAIVGFDVMNEPYWGSTAIGEFETEKLQPFYERVVKAVRTVAPQWVAFLEPAASSNLGVPTGLTTMPFPNVVYAPHLYNRDAELGNGFDPTMREQLMRHAALLRDEADSLGAALWIGEYGGTTGSPGFSEYMDAACDGMSGGLASGMYWSYDRDGGYGVLNEDGSEKPNLLDAIVRPYPELVAGRPVAMAFDEATRVFTFEYLPEGGGETVLSAPRRVYPDGFKVACDDCQYEEREGRLVITSAPKSSPAKVTLSAKPTSAP
jgi:endoglycosylceramidase